MADALDLGSSPNRVQVQVLLSAPNESNPNQSVRVAFYTKEILAPLTKF